MTEAQYLEFEKNAEVRHEFEDGVLWAISGGKLKHNEIVFNIKAALVGAAYPRGCRISSENMKVQTGTRYYYPDVAVTCEPISLESDTLHAPCAVFEVLSPSTESRNLGVKFRAYTLLIPSLEQYFLVSSDFQMVEVYTRASGGIWSYQRFSLEENVGQSIPVRCLNTTLTFEQIYLYLPMNVNVLEDNDTDTF